MKQPLTLRQRYFWTLLAGGAQSLLSSFLTLLLLLCLLLAVQSERIDKVARWVKAEPATRARALATWLAKSDFVERASIAEIARTEEGTHTRETHTRAWFVEDASFLLASGVEVRFRSLSFLPRRLRVQGLRVVVPTKGRGATTETEEQSREMGSQEFWHKLVRQVGFFSSLATEHTLTLEDSLILVAASKQHSSGQHSLRLRFKEIVANNRNGLVWRGRGVNEARGAESASSVVLSGSYAIASQRLFQSLRIEGFSPREMLRLLVRKNENKSLDAFQRPEVQKPETKATRLWLEGKGQLSLDYRFDLRESQSWLRVRFARSTDANALDKKAALSFDHATDTRRTGLTNTSIGFRALPIGVVWHASDLLLPSHLSHLSMPFQLSGRLSGRLSMQRQQRKPNRFLGNLSLETPRFRWNESNESALVRRLTLAIEGSDEKVQITTALDLDPIQNSGQGSGQGSGLDKKITILPHEEDAAQKSPLSARWGLRRAARKKLNLSKFRLALEGSSRGGVPIETIRALWPPRFKPQTRATVVDVAKKGEVTDLTLALDVVIDLKANTKRLANLDGTFLLQKGRLQLFAAPATLTEVEARARFAKREILFKIERALYEDFRIEDGEVSFERKTLANDEKHTLMRVAIFGEGAAESLRRFALNAPFLQELESMQRSARWLPRAPRATAKGHINLSAFLDQLDVEASKTIFPHPLSYDTAWQVEGIRLQAPFLRFYEGSATLASTSSVPLVLTTRMDSDRGRTLKGRWHIALPNVRAVRQQQEVQGLTLEGKLDAEALASDFSYLPLGWLQKDLPFSLSYSDKAGASQQGALSVAFPRSRLRVESSQSLKDAPTRLSGSILPDKTNVNAQNSAAKNSAAKNSAAQDSAWQIEGRFRPQGKTSLLLERGGEKEKSLTLLLENLPKQAGETNAALKTAAQKTTSQKNPAEWRLTLEGEKLDVSRWLEQKPWRTLVEEEGDEASPSLGWGGLFNLTFDARLKKLRLHTPLDASAPQPNDLLEEVHASLRWQDEKIRKVFFSSHSLPFARSQQRRRKKATRRARTQVFYTLREGQELFSAHIEDLGSFLHQALGKNLADGGKAQVSLVRSHREHQRPKPHFEGYATVRNVSLYDLPLLLKIFDAVDFVSAFRKGIRGLDLRSDLQLWDGILTLKEFSLANNLTALSANGSLDLRERKLDLRGEIASLHLISKILRNIPLIGAIIVGRKRHNLFAFSYEAKGGWSDPKVTASPLNLLLPGIVKIANPLQLLERDDIKKAQDKKREQIADEQRKNKTAEEEKTP